MRKILVALALVLATLGVTTPAQAASVSQKIAVTSGSHGWIESTTTSVHAGQTKSINKYELLKIHGVSWQVKYSGGNWGSCHPYRGEWFDASNTPSKITFAVYSEPKCRIAL